MLLVIRAPENHRKKIAGVYSVRHLAKARNTRIVAVHAIAAARQPRSATPETPKAPTPGSTHRRAAGNGPSATDHTFERNMTAQGHRRPSPPEPSTAPKVAAEQMRER